VNLSMASRNNWNGFPKFEETKAVEGGFQLWKAEFEFTIITAKHNLGDKCDGSLQSMYLWESLGHVAR